MQSSFSATNPIALSEAEGEGGRRQPSLPQCNHITCSIQSIPVQISAVMAITSVLGEDVSVRLNAGEIIEVIVEWVLIINYLV